MLKSDIFFMVTTASIVLITIGIIVAFVYIIRILRNTSKVSDAVREEGQEIIKHVSEVRTKVRDEGLDIFAIVKSLIGLITRKSRPRKK